MQSNATVLIFLAAWLLAYVLTATSVSAEPTSTARMLIPTPMQLDVKAAKLSLDPTLRVYVEGMSEQRQRFQLSRLQLHLSRASNTKVKIAEVDKQSANLTILIRQQERDLTIPQYGEDESYELTIHPQGLHIKAQSVFGAQHALTTLVQLAYSQQTKASANNTLLMPLAHIQDQPRFAWRGLLIDSVRHFLPVTTIKRQLDGMAAAKLNVFHWHLTDDQGWRVESKRFPRLTEKASDGDFYSQAEIKEIVEYASLLGIRVLPEIGMPGHASAIAVAYPELMTKVKHYEMERHWGVFKPLLDIANPKVYEFVDALIGEMVLLFPDAYFHIGGDEVEAEHWLEDQKIKVLMENKKLKNGADLQNYFNSKVQPIIAKHNRKMVGWDEIFHPQLPQQIVVQSWRGHDSLNAVAKAGYQGVLSTGFYIDQPQYTDYHYRNDPHFNRPKLDLTQPKHGAKQFVIERLKGSAVRGELVMLGDQLLIKLNNNHHQLAQLMPSFSTQQLNAQMDSWMGPLSFEFIFAKNSGFVLIGNSRYSFTLKDLDTPNTITLSPTLSAEQQALILGGEATMWSEMVTKDNIDLRIWPRLFAIAERLWSPANTNDAEHMYVRLDVVNAFAAEVIGLAHLAQQQQGFNALIDKTLPNTEQQNTLSQLNTMAQMLEPSHYYTRHHIKYLNNAYHQQAPLDLYVDFLAVESKQVRLLNNQVNAYQLGDKQALANIAQQIMQWQKALQLGKGLLARNARLSSLQHTFNRLQSFIALTQQVVKVCQGQQTQQKLDEQLLALQNLTDELVISAIYPIRNLFLQCAAAHK